MVLFLVALTRAFNMPANEILQPRQVAELAYRNAVVRSFDPMAVEKAHQDLELIENTHPFLSKADRKWIQTKRAELKKEKSSLAMDTRARGVRRP